MIWRNILIGGAAIALGNGFALNPDGQVSPMISQDLAVTPRGRVEYVVPYPESGARSSFDVRHRVQEDEDQ